MGRSLEGKVVVITGAAGVLGRAAARVTAERGAAVVLVDRERDALERVAGALPAGTRSLVVRADVTDESSVQEYVRAAVKELGRVDALFNNAGIEGPVAPLDEYPKADFERVLAVNVLGVFLGMKHVVPVMKRQGKGSIINTSSTSGVTGAAGVHAYTASKHAVIGMTRSAAAELAAHRIRVNALCPGPIESRMMDSLAEGMAPGESEAIHARIRAAIPAGRYGRPEEIAALVAFLVSDESEYMHGGFYMADGGFSAV